MARQIENIFGDFPNYNCFACGPRNAIGLRLVFFADDEKGEAFTRVRPKEIFSGFPGILHGGLQTTIIDEVSFWAIFDRYKKMALTIKIEIDFKKVLPTEKTIEARARIESERKRVIASRAWITDDEGEIYVEAKTLYYLADERQWFEAIPPDRFPEPYRKYIT